ncbi:autotransporter domain-containing protein [Proteus sp. CD3]|uniref:autotransporter domain-containing protein n=1 Tax=Proteus sp. CD3 TaxID=1921565 RepID=UPI0022408243|nr:autotransporter domain-containing protein [Proteus sp. CD3]
MLIRKKIFKLSIITSIIILSSFSHANIPNELSATDPISFFFDQYPIQNVKDYKHSQHHHGVLGYREKNNIYTSKYSTVIINSIDNKNTISFDYGAHFEPLEIENIDKIKIISLSQDGLYVIGNGRDKNKALSQLFIYNTVTKEVKFLSNKDNNYYTDDHFLTTEDGRFSLYADHDESYIPLMATHDGYLPYNKMVYTIYDNKKNGVFPLKLLDKTDLKNHPEQARFNVFNNLNFIEKFIDRKPQIETSTLDGNYLYGSLLRDSKNESNTNIAFVYHTANDKLMTLTSSNFGSSKINAVSKNNIFIGWYESWDDNKKILFRQSFFYAPSDRNFTKINPLYDTDSKFNFKANSEATDISDDGNIIVGWSEYNEKRNGESELSNSHYLRNAFVYKKDKNEIIALKNINMGNESEAYSISGDGNVVFGVANDRQNNWKLVTWKLQNSNNSKQNKNHSEQNKNNEKTNIENVKTLAKKDIYLTKNLYEKLKLDLEKERNSLFSLKENLEKKQAELKNQQNEAIQKRETMTPLLDKNENDYFSKNIHTYEGYGDVIENNKNEINRIEQQLNSLDNSQEGQNVKFIESQYNQAKTALAQLQTIPKKETEQDRLAKEQADKAKAEQDRLAKEQADKAKAEQDRLAKEQANKAKAEQDRIAKEQADKAKAEQERLAKEQANKAKAEQDRIAKEQADKAKAEQERLAKEQADKAKAEQERLAKEQADKAKAEQDRLAKEQADKAKAEQDRLAKEQADKAKEQADKAKAEQERLAKEQADKAKAEQERLAKEQADKAKAEQERLAKEQADKAKGEQDRLAKEQADKAKAEQNRLAKEQEKIEPSIIASKPIDIKNTYKSMILMAENDYKFMDIQQGQLRHLASATCSVGTEKACISGFAHYQNVNKANATQTGLSGAYRFDINAIPFVVGLAIDTDVYSSLPKGYQYQGYALPLIGFSLDLMPSLNAELNSDALHLSLKGAYLNRKVSIERQILEDTEAGKGNAKISGYHIELQGYFPYSINDELLLTPFAGLTFNQISRSAYSETQNAQFAVHYDPLNAHSLLAKMGLGMDHLLGSSFILNTKAGFLWDLSHHQGDFGSHIDYLGQQKIDYTENKKQLTQRPFAHIGLTYQVDKHSSIGTKANWEMTTYRNHDMQFGINYAYRF